MINDPLDMCCVGNDIIANIRKWSIILFFKKTVKISCQGNTDDVVLYVLPSMEGDLNIEADSPEMLQQIKDDMQKINEDIIEVFAIQAYMKKNLGHSDELSGEIFEEFLSLQKIHTESAKNIFNKYSGK